MHKINTVIVTILLLSLMYEGREKYCERYNYKKHKLEESQENVK